MKKLLFPLLLNMLACLAVCAQNIGIGTNAPHNSAKLEVTSTNSGVLLPRLTSAERKSIASPAKGLLVFDTDFSTFFFFDGLTWKPLSYTSAKTLLPATIGAPEPSSYGQFGYGVAVWGDYMAVGSTGTGTVPLNASGAVYIFKKTAGTWLQIQKIVAPDPAAHDRFGYAVDLDSNYLIIGAPNKTVGDYSGHGKAYIYKLNGNAWNFELALLTVASPSDQFGFDVAISSETDAVFAIVGAPGKDAGAEENKGAAYIYRKNLSTGNWFGTTLQPADLQPEDNFGFSVAIDNHLAVVGAPFQDGSPNNNRGVAYPYFFDDGVWQPEQKILSSSAKSNFGYEVCVEGPAIAIGAPYTETTNDNSGYVQLHKRTSANNYPQEQFITLEAPNHNAANRFGMEVKMSGNFLLIGAPADDLNLGGGDLYMGGIPGTVYIYEKGLVGGYVMINQLKATVPAYNDRFGSAMAIHGKNYVIGCIRSTVNGFESAGEIYTGVIE